MGAAGKTGRTRYLRLFPERVDFLLARLAPVQLAAYLRITVEYCVRDGELLADDKLARVAKLPPRAWAALRDELVTLGVVRIEGGRWVDDDQDENLYRQRKFSDQQRERARRRWKPEVVR